MTIQEWKEQCSKMGYTAREISDLSGVPIETVRAVVWGTEIPKFKLWERLDETLKQATSNMIREEAVAYYVQDDEREYAIEDYLAIPNGIRVELIDGKIYDMATPTTIHQALLVKLVTQLENYIIKNKGQCVSFVAPLDVKLGEDNKTMVQPDIFVVCDRDKLNKGNIIDCVPDFVIEILSPSTRYKDSGLKMNKYKDTGVKEYWLVDLEQKRVVVYEFAHTAIPQIYGFDSKVPVGIFGNQCEVDFTEIYQEIKFMFE